MPGQSSRAVKPRGAVQPLESLGHLSGCGVRIPTGHNFNTKRIKRYTVYLAYVDDSGNPGPQGSYSFALGCVIVEADRWLATLDRIVEYRRYLRDKYGIPIGMELKANRVIRGSGPLHRLGLSVDTRRRVYRGHLRIHPDLGTRVFAVVIGKERHFRDPVGGPVERRAWEWLLQRLERFTEDRQSPLLLLHDEGNDEMIHSMARKWRRAGSAGSRYGTGRIARPFRRLVDDAVPRKSHQSLVLQLSDFAAYAAFRKVYPPSLATASDPSRVVSAGAWDLIGSARLARVSPRRGDGIVAWI